MNMEVSSQPQEIHNGGDLRNTLSKLIEECNSEPDIDKKIQLFYKVNSILPEKDKVIIGYIRTYKFPVTGCRSSKLYSVL